jgi:ACS family D-galactonate transporter-like MFS transporter
LATDVAETQTDIPGRRWRISWLLGIGILVNYFDRVNLSASHAALITAFGISDVAFGYLSGAYNLTYWFCQLPIGVILDKFGVRRVGRAGTFLWSVATFAGAAAPSLGALFGARFLLGVGEAPTFPASAKAVGHWFPPGERSLATALFDSMAKFSSVIGIPLIGYVLIKAGWRWSFAMTGVISLLYFIYFWCVYRDPEEDAGLSEAERRYIAGGEERADQADEQGSSLWQLLGQRKVLGLALGFGSYNYIFYLLLTWLPSYFAFALHIDLLHSFLYTSLPWLFATLCELVVGGWLVDFLVKRGADASRVRRTVLIGGACCGLGILGAARAHSATQALLWISLSIGGLSAHSAVGWSLPSFIAQRRDVGKVGGIVNFSNQVSGVCAPIVTGYLVSALHSYAWVFGVSAIYLAIGIGGYIFLLGRIERPRQQNSPTAA